MAKTYSKEELDGARDLRGQLPPGRKLDNLTALERAVLVHQGLVGDDGDILPEAFAKVEDRPELPAHIPAPIPLEELEPEVAERITDAVSEAKGASADAAEVDVSMQVDAPLPPPDSDDVETAKSDTDEDRGFGATSATINIETLIQGAKEPVPCPRCAYDMRQRFKEPPSSEADKAAFVRHVLSRCGRFEKSYEILGGEGVVTFRSRSQAEMEFIFSYMRKMLQQEDVLPGGDYMTQMERFHIAASVVSINDKNDLTNTEKFPTLDELIAKGGGGDALAELDKLVFGSGRPAGIYSIIVPLWMEFDRLYGWFSSKAHDPDFWRAAAGQHC